MMKILLRDILGGLSLFQEIFSVFEAIFFFWKIFELDFELIFFFNIEKKKCS